MKIRQYCDNNSPNKNHFNLDKKLTSEIPNKKEQNMFTKLNN